MNFGRVEVDAPRGLGSAGCVLDLTEVVPTLSSKEKKTGYWISRILDLLGLLVMEIGRRMTNGYDAYGGFLLGC